MITLERKFDTKPDGSDEEPRGIRRIELITGVMPKACDARGRRRQWSTAERSRILLESLEPGANVSEVARRNGVSPQQLFGWRREARALIVDDAGAATGTAPSDRGRDGFRHPSLRTVQAVFPHTALQSVVSSSGPSR